MTPDLRPYVTLLSALLSNRLNPVEFQAILVPLFKGDNVWRPQNIYDTLNEIFLAAEAFTPDASEGNPYTVTEEQLHHVAEEGLRRLEILMGM
jgi:Bacterial self-protective colicin-like immunity